MNSFQETIQSDASNIYSKELLESDFKSPYTKIKYIEKDLGVYRQTASKYLDKLVSLKLLSEHKVGNTKYYINLELADIVINANNA